MTTTHPPTTGATPARLQWGTDTLSLDLQWDDEHPVTCAGYIIRSGHHRVHRVPRVEILTADAGIVPFERSDFNEAALPYRILKYARLGRRTVMRDLPGAHTWAHAISFADTPEAFADALLAEGGTRERPHAELRAWALEQTPQKVNAPLWARLRELGVPTQQDT